MLWNWIVLVVGAMLIMRGGDLFTDSAVAIAQTTRIPKAIVGATVVSVATTFPEFMVSLTGALRGQPDFAVGNALGSCQCNIGLIVGTTALLKGVLARKRGTEPGIPAGRGALLGPGMFMLAAGVAAWAFSSFDAGDTGLRYGIAPWQAVILLVVFIVYVAYSIITAFQSQEGPQGDHAAAAERVKRQVILFLVGAGLVALGSRLMVANAEAIAKGLGWPERVIGLTILAVGTSLPEYVVSAMAVWKGHGSLGIGNILGANILNICWVVATCALIGPLPIQESTVFLDGPVALLLMFLLVGLAWRRERISVPSGAVLFAVYVAYIVTLLTSS